VLHFGKRAGKKECKREERAAARFMTIKGLKVKEIEIELRSVYGDDSLQISAIKKRRTSFLQRRRELSDDPRSGKPPFLI
jgi:hypothetical protein